MWLILVLSLASLISASSITNGTCYYKANTEAAEIYSPCGNTIDGQWPCCQLGDKCNNYNTCTWTVGDGTYYTYVAGCTDPDYQDSSCPDKGQYSDHQWVGLAWKGCNLGSNGLVNWVGCNNDGNPEVRVSNESKNCECNDDDYPLIVAPTGLVAEGYLPTTTMGEISWFPGWSRTDPVALSTSSGTSGSVSTRTLASATTRGSSTTTSTGTDTMANDGSSDSTYPAATLAQTSSADGSQHEDTHTGEIAGLAVSGALVGFVAISVAVFLLYRRRRAKKEEEEKEQTLPFNDNPQDQAKNDPTIPSIPATLNAESTQHNSTITSEHSELPGTPADPSLMSTAASPSTIHPAPKNEYDVYYRPYQYRDPSSEIGLASGSPETTRSERWQAEYQPYKRPQAVNPELYRHASGAASSHGQDSNVHELPGCVPDEPSSCDASNAGREDGMHRRAEL